MENVKFMYNGIKINGKLIKGNYSKGGYLNGAKICFYADSYWSDGLREVFNVKNDSEMMTDYFEKDRIYFFGNEPYFTEIEKAWAKKELKWIDKYIAQLLRMAEHMPRYKDSYLNDIRIHKERKIECMNILAA